MNNKGKAQGGGKKPRPSYPDDRTKNVKIIDTVGRILAVILAVMVLINVRSLVQGGGYEDSKLVPLFGISNSRIEESYMKPEIADNSVIISRATASIEEGDIVQYYDGKLNPVSRVVKVSGDNVTLKGDSEKTSVTVKKSDVKGKVVFHTTALYGFFGVYHTALGAVITVLLTIILLSLGDLLMIKKRKKALEEKRALQAKKEARKLKNKDKTGEAGSDLGNIEDKVATQKAKKQEKINKDRDQVAKDMELLQEKMKKEEEDFYKERKGK